MKLKNTPILAFVLVALSGGLYAFSNVGYGYWPFVFFYLVPLWLALDQLKDRNWKVVTLAGFIFGFTAFAFGFPWLLTLTDKFLGSGLAVGFFLWCLLGIWFSLGFALYTLVYRSLLQLGIPQYVAAISPLLVLEWVQPSLFPSFGGAALIAKPVLAQIADLGGVLLLSLFVFVVNCAIYSIYRSMSERRSLPIFTIITTSLLILVVATYGSFKLKILAEEKELAVTNSLNIGAIQSNLVMLPKSEMALKSHPEYLKQSLDFLSKESVDLLIWPESAYVRGLRRPLPLDAQFIRGDIKIPIMFGGTSIWQHEGRKVSANSVFLSDERGLIEQVYDKTMLIPFAEYIPFEAQLTSLQETIDNWFPQRQSFYSEGKQQALILNDIPIITPICYEIIFPDLVRELINNSKAQVIVTVANDAWFGFSQEPWIHLSFARLRAIEHRRWMVRATNSGISAIVDPAGQIVSQTGLHTQETLRGVVYPRTESTFYSRFGNWIGWLSLVTLLIALFISRGKTYLRESSTEGN